VNTSGVEGVKDEVFEESEEEENEDNEAVDEEEEVEEAVVEDDLEDLEDVADAEEDDDVHSAPPSLVNASRGVGAGEKVLMNPIAFSRAKNTRSPRWIFSSNCRPGSARTRDNATYAWPASNTPRKLITARSSVCPCALCIVNCEAGREEGRTREEASAKDARGE
jgi:hypothetical protein